MDEEAQRHRNAEAYAEMQRRHAEDEARAAQQWATESCAKCPEAKRLRDEVLTLKNGIGLRVRVMNCAGAGSDCTAAALSHFPTLTPDVANELMVKLCAVPDLKAAGVEYMITLHWSAERFSMVYPASALALVMAVTGSVPESELVVSEPIADLVARTCRGDS